MRSIRSALLVATALPASGRAAFAQTDHLNLERGFPTRLEDAYPIAFRGRELQLVTTYVRTDEPEDRLVLEPAFELGFARNWQGRVSAPFLSDDDLDSRGSGDLHLDALFNPWTESVSVPALALAGGIDLPTGEDSEGLDTRLGLILTRTIDDDHFGRAHLDLEWGHNAEALSDERDDTFLVVAGYSFRLHPDWIAVLDAYREHEIEEDVESNALEAGVRWQLRPLVVLSFGAAAGFGDESEEGSATLGVQISI